MIKNDKKSWVGKMPKILLKNIMYNSMAMDLNIWEKLMFS